MTLDKKKKNLLSFFLRFGLSAGLLFYIFTTIDVDNTTAVLKSADLNYLTYALIIFGAVNFVILFRWMIFIRALKLDTPLSTATRFFFIGLFGNLFLPSAIGGDVLKILGLCKNSDSKTKVVASVLLDRLSGFASMVIIATVAFVIGFRYINDVTVAVSIVGMAVVSSTIAVILFNETIYSFCCKVFAYFPRIQKGLMNLHYDVVLLKDRKDAIYKAIALSCFSQMVLVIIFYLFARALHQDVALIYFFIFVPLICVASAFPSIGGLGVREAGAAYLFVKAGVDAGVGASIGLLNSLFMIIVGLIGGIIFMTTKSSQLLEQQEQSEIISA